MRKDERVIKDMKDVDFSVQDILSIILKTIKEPKHKYTIECIDMFNTIYLLQERIDKAIEYIKEHKENEYRNGRDDEMYLELNEKELGELLEILGDKENE